MDKTLSPQRQQPKQNQRTHLLNLLLLPHLNLKIPINPNPISAFTIWVLKPLRNFCNRAKPSKGYCFRSLRFTAMVVNNSAFCDSSEKTEEIGSEIRGFDVGSDYLASESTVNEIQSGCSSEDSFSPNSTGEVLQRTSPDVSEEGEKPHLDVRKLGKQGSSISEIEMMKERFSKLLLGEDMSGSGNGVSTALAISNAITNLCATLFGQLWRLEPLPNEKKSMWRREMEWLLCVSDHIVELIPSWQTFPDGSKLEVMTSRPRSDLYINLPALRKLDNMLLEILDSYENTEFWYVDRGISAPDADGSSSYRRPLPRQEDKWWLPVPRVAPTGLSDNSRKQLQHRRDCTNQILKAAMAINSVTLADMEVPDSYYEALPKNGRTSLGDLIHKYITSDQFSPECLIECLDLSSEYQALEIANRVEASIYVWRRRINAKPLTNRSNSKSSWEMVKDLVIDVDKRELLSERAESLLLSIKQRFPGLPQTALDMSKIQYNKDVGKSILESYSRVLESLAFNIVARIDDVLYVDDLTKHSSQILSISKVGVITRKSVSSSPFKTAFTTPSFSLVPFHDGGSKRGFGVKKILTDYLSMDTKGKDHSNGHERSTSISSTTNQHESESQEPY